MLNVEILIPHLGNDKRSLAVEKATVRASLCAAFGGLSEPGRTVTGHYINDAGETQYDTCHVWELSVPALLPLYRELFSACAVLRQECIMVRIPALGYSEIIGKE